MSIVVDRQPISSAGEIDEPARIGTFTEAPHEVLDATGVG